MRAIRCIIIPLLLSSVTIGAGKPVKSPEKGPTPADANLADVNDIAQYYGFGEIEMVKLDYGIQNLTIGDFDGDGLKDIAVANNTRASNKTSLQFADCGFR